MEYNDYGELIKRADDLARRCERSGTITATGFLTPAEQEILRKGFHGGADVQLLFSGGGADCERAAAFFLPDYIAPEDFQAQEHICAIRLTAHFGSPGHRDYMGAILAMGVGREWVGDISVTDNVAYVYCLPSVLRHLLSIDKVGRFGVTAEELELSAVPQRERQASEKSFSVMSMRLDAMVGGMFNLSRTESAKQINAGNVTVNYLPCLKTDQQIKPGDTISLKGMGKGQVSGTGGTSRKGRLFVNAEIFK